jgi:hypothetical protein
LELDCRDSSSRKLLWLDSVQSLAGKQQLASKGLSARRNLEIIGGVQELCSHSSVDKNISAPAHCHLKGGIFLQDWDYYSESVLRQESVISTALEV